MTNKCRFGSGFDRAIIAMNGPGVDVGKLITNDYSKVTAVEAAGMWGLTYLTGQYAVVENIPSNDTTWGKLSLLFIRNWPEELTELSHLDEQD